MVYTYGTPFILYKIFMVTKLIGVKEFRQHMAKFTLQARRYGWRYIVLSRNEPLFEVKPLSKRDAVLEKLAADVAEARAEYKAGHSRPIEEVFRSLGL